MSNGESRGGLKGIELNFRVSSLGTSCSRGNLITYTWIVTCWVLISGKVFPGWVWTIGAMSSPGHEIQRFFTSYSVPHFPEVWECGKVRQSKDIVSLSPSHEPFVILYLVPHFSEVWKCGIVWQTKDIAALFPQSWTLCHSLLCSTLLRGVEVWNNVTN